MKKILVLFLLNFTLFAAHIDEFAKNMNFERDYNTALSKAKTTDKVLMIVLSSDYCPWCRKFENKTLSSKLIKPKLDKEVISLVVDKKFDVDSFPKKFRTNYTPMVFFINPKDESILSDTVGYIKKKDFLNAIDNANNLYKNKK